jgi:hypothetical protein
MSQNAIDYAGTDEVDVAKQYEQKHGAYKSNVPEGPVEERLPTVSLPMVPSKLPFDVGNDTGGER